MLQQFSYAYLRQSPLADAAAAARVPAQSTQAALTFFAAKSQAPHSESPPVDSNGRSHRNGKHGPNGSSETPRFVKELAAELDRLERHCTSFFEGLWLRLAELVEHLQRVTGKSESHATASQAADDAPGVADLSRLCDALGDLDQITKAYDMQSRRKQTACC